MRSNSSAVVGSALQCLPPPLLFRGPLDKALVPLSTRYPLSANIINISSSTLSHEPPSLPDCALMDWTSVFNDITFNCVSHLHHTCCNFFSHLTSHLPFLVLFLFILFFHALFCLTSSWQLSSAETWLCVGHFLFTPFLDLLVSFYQKEKWLAWSKFEVFHNFHFRDLARRLRLAMA